MLTRLNTVLAGLFWLSGSVFAQNATDPILEFRKEYIREFLDNTHSPLTEADTAFLQFFAPDTAYITEAVFKPTPEAKPFEIATSSGKTKTYQSYGTATFTLHDTVYSLVIYQSLRLLETEEYTDYLIIPFNDLTNGQTTYGGGRYLDLSLGDIKGDRVTIDFNRCYNPYFAYAGGYSCPVPPAENNLPSYIEAGEKMFTGTYKD